MLSFKITDSPIGKMSEEREVAVFSESKTVSIPPLILHIESDYEVTYATLNM